MPPSSDSLGQKETLPHLSGIQVALRARLALFFRLLLLRPVPKKGSLLSVLLPSSSHQQEIRVALSILLRVPC